MTKSELDYTRKWKKHIFHTLKGPGTRGGVHSDSVFIIVSKLASYTVVPDTRSSA